MDKVKYSKEIKQIRKVLNDHEYTRTLSPGYHQFLSDMHTKMVSANRISPKMEKHINQAFDYYKNHHPNRSTEKAFSIILIQMRIYSNQICVFTELSAHPWQISMQRI